MKETWINSMKKLPPKGKNVIVCSWSGDIRIMYYVPKKKNYCWGWYPGGIFINNSYWMTLPEIPDVIKVDMEKYSLENQFSRFMSIQSHLRREE